MHDPLVLIEQQGEYQGTDWVWALLKKNGKETPEKPLFKNAERFACH